MLNFQAINMGMKRMSDSPPLADFNRRGFLRKAAAVGAMVPLAGGQALARTAASLRSPGPALRGTEGEHLRIRFINGSKHPHSMHFHGIHAARMDGVAGASLVAP